MSQNRRFNRIGLAVAAGLMALVGFAPSGAIASTSSTHSHVLSIPRGDNWCC